MAKKKRVEIPLLAIDPVQEESVKILMARMRGNYQGAVAPQNEPDEVGVHMEKVGVFTPTQIALVGVNTPTENKSVLPQEKHVGVHKKDRHAADKQKVNFYLRRDIFKEFSLFARQHDLTLTAFFEQAGVHFMQSVGVHKEKHVGVNTPHDDHDDLMMWKTDDDIIMRYRALTGNKWKPDDDRLAQEFNGVNPVVIEIGMVMALFRTKAKRINSFNYFLSPIREAIEETAIAKMGEQSLREYLQYAHTKLAAKRQASAKGGND